MSTPDLERLLAAERPAPRAAWTAELDARVAAGFPRPGGARGAGRPRLRLPRVALAPALGAGVALILVVVVVSRLTSSDQAATMASSAVGTRAVHSAPAVSSGSATGDSATSGAAPAAEAAPRSAAAPFAGRQVERATQLTVAVRAARMQSTAQQVYRVTGAFGGVVDSSEVSSGTRSGGASFGLRIPAGRLGPALARLAALGRVRSQTGSTRDVTGAFTTVRERLDAASAERSGLLRALTKAVTATQVDALKARLRLASGRIAAERAALRRLHGRVDYARVSLQLVAAGAAPAPVHHGGGGYTPGRALHDAARILRVAAAITIVALAVALPLALLAAALGLAGRGVRRRRREAALGPA